MRKSSEIYATTTHEIAHAAHWKMDRNGWASKESVIIESFARGVQWHLTRKLYDGYKVNYYNKGKYTGVIQDLIDNDMYYGLSPEIGDKVTGYTIAEVEKALRGCKTWEAWKNNIINQYPYNNTKDYVEEAFDYWNPAN